MPALLVLLLAVVSRFLPVVHHSAGYNFTAVGGSLLFFGSRLSPRFTPAALGKLLGAVAVMMASDYVLTTFVYRYPFQPAGYVVTWLWYAAVVLLGAGLLQRPSVLRVAAAALAAPTSFFLLSNFMVWAGGAMYPRTPSGLAGCYLAALPFYRNDLVSTALTAAVLFTLPVLLRSSSTVPSASPSASQGSRLA